jgi:hypothetical protein
MSIARSASQEESVPPARRPWQPPVLSELSLRTATKSNGEFCEPPDHPPEPAAPVAKLGFSLEAALPLASRSGK